MSPSSGDALLCFVKRAVPAGSKGTNWYRQSSGCCGGVVTQAYGQPDNPVSSRGKSNPAILTAAPFRGLPQR
ncbi:hypothetical protein AAG94_19945 [Escherichia albertii]|nr:hypothetical protein [Escherichia albertii]